MELKKGETKWVCREKAVLSEACVRWGVTGEGDGAGVKTVPPGKEKYECSPLCADKRPSAGGRGPGHAAPAAAAAPGRGSPAAPGNQGQRRPQHSGGAGSPCPRTTRAGLERALLRPSGARRGARGARGEGSAVPAPEPGKPRGSRRIGDPSSLDRRTGRLSAALGQPGYPWAHVPRAPRARRPR